MGYNSAMRSIGGWFLHNFAIFVIMLAMLFHHEYCPVSAFAAGCIVLMLAFQVLHTDVFSAFGIGVFCGLAHFAIDHSFRFAGMIPVVSEVALFAVTVLILYLIYFAANLLGESGITASVWVLVGALFVFYSLYFLPWGHKYLGFDHLEIKDFMPWLIISVGMAGFLFYMLSLGILHLFWAVLFHFLVCLFCYFFNMDMHFLRCVSNSCNVDGYILDASWQVIRIHMPILGFIFLRMIVKDKMK